LPVLECVESNADGTYTAHFGYDNPNSFDVSIPIGGSNFFVPLPLDRGQPTLFVPGRQVDVFTVVFPTFSLLVWTLDGGTAIARSGGPPCN
jgi:hypothetical protein